VVRIGIEENALGDREAKRFQAVMETVRLVHTQGRLVRVEIDTKVRLLVVQVDVKPNEAQVGTDFEEEMITDDRVHAPRRVVPEDDNHREDSAHEEHARPAVIDTKEGGRVPHPDRQDDDRALRLHRPRRRRLLIHRQAINPVEIIADKSPHQALPPLPLSFKLNIATENMLHVLTQPKLRNLE